MFTIQSSAVHGVCAPSIVSNGDAHTGFRDEHGLIVAPVTTRPYADNDGRLDNLVLAHGQGNAEHVKDGCPSLTCNHEAPILFVNGKNQLPKIIGTLNSSSGRSVPGNSVQDAGAGMLLPNNTNGDRWTVRRLTPRECERLQGFEDDYTLIKIKKKMSADGPRYKALGNSMAVPVTAWLGRRIEQVDKIPIA